MWAASHSSPAMAQQVGLRFWTEMEARLAVGVPGAPQSSAHPAVLLCPSIRLLWRGRKALCAPEPAAPGPGPGAAASATMSRHWCWVVASSPRVLDCGMRETPLGLAFDPALLTSAGAGQPTGPSCSRPWGTLRLCSPVGPAALTLGVRVRKAPCGRARAPRPPAVQPPGELGRAVKATLGGQTGLVGRAAGVRPGPQSKSLHHEAMADLGWSLWTHQTYPTGPGEATGSLSAWEGRTDTFSLSFLL